MQFSPISPEEADSDRGAFEPLPAGEYDFSVREAVETTSKAGSEMIKLTLDVMTKSGTSRTVFDYLLSTSGGQWKVRHFAESVDMTRQYDAGHLDADAMVGRSGRLKLAVRPAEGQYAASNVVRDYLPPKLSAKAVKTEWKAPAPAAVTPQSLDDEIPF